MNLCSTDDFVCNFCCARGAKNPDPDANRTRHSYMHPLVQCKPLVEEHIPSSSSPGDVSAAAHAVHPEASEESVSLAALRERIIAMDSRFTQVEAQVAQLVRAQQEMHKMLLDVLKKHRETTRAVDG